MSVYTAIRAVSNSLKELLEEHITNSAIPGFSTVSIDLRSPKEIPPGGNRKWVSLWLYRVTRNAETLNNPPPRPAPNQQARAPIPLNLYYLVTPLAEHPEDEQAIAGRVLQVLNDHPTLRGTALFDDLVGGTEELRTTLESLTLEELTRIWNSLQASYQLSLPYLVQIVSIDSAHEPIEGGPVVEKETTYAQILSVT